MIQQRGSILVVGACRAKPLKDSEVQYPLDTQCAEGIFLPPLT